MLRKFRWIKNLAWLLAVLLFAAIILSLYFLFDEASYLILSLSYWLILFFWIVMVVAFRLKVQVTFVLSFVFFVLASFFSGISIYEVGEILMKISFIGWVIGLGEALWEYHRT